MNFDIGAAWDNVKDGTKEAFEVAHEKTSSFHENYVSKVIPDCGKYGDEAKFVAEMVPGVAEYNAIRDGDWVAFAIAAGIDIAAITVAAFTAGAGYGAVKGGTEIAKAGVKVAAKELAEAGAEKLAKEVVEAGVEKLAKEAIESGVETVAKEAIEAGVEKAAKEAVEASVEKVAKEAVETGVEKVTKEAAEAGAEKIAKEAAETAIKESAENGAERAVLEVGDKIDVTRFSEYVDEIEQITKREISPQQKELIETAIKENDYKKLSTEATKLAREEFNKGKKALIQTWEKMNGKEWPKYVDDVVNDAGDIIRSAGQPYDAHHIIELSTGGPNQWWNLHPAKFPSEHQNGIHAAGKLAKKIFG